MDNNLYGVSAREGADHPNEWQQAEKRNSQSNEDDMQSFDLRSAEANGYGTEDSHALKSDENDGKEEGDTADNDADEPTVSDWGDVDPQNDGVPSSNDPTAPGSAV